MIPSYGTHNKSKAKRLRQENAKVWRRWVEDMLVERKRQERIKRAKEEAEQGRDAIHVFEEGES